MTAGDALRAVLEALDVPQAAFAQEVGISTKHLNQLIRGNANFTPETAVLIADAVALRLVSIDTRYRMEQLRRMEGRVDG